MKYQVLESIKLKTSKGEIELLPEQVVTLPHDIVIKLINKGKITPIDNNAYKLYSKLLNDTLWIVTDQKHMHDLRSHGITEPIYTYHDIITLKQKPKDEIKAVLPAIHKAKMVFPMSRLENIEKENI